MRGFRESFPQVSNSKLQHFTQRRMTQDSTESSHVWRRSSRRRRTWLKVFVNSRRPPVPTRGTATRSAACLPVTASEYVTVDHLPTPDTEGLYLGQCPKAPLLDSPKIHLTRLALVLFKTELTNNWQLHKR